MRRGRSLAQRNCCFQCVFLRSNTKRNGISIKHRRKSNSGDACDPSCSFVGRQQIRSPRSPKHWVPNGMKQLIKIPAVEHVRLLDGRFGSQNTRRHDHRSAKPPGKIRPCCGQPIDLFCSCPARAHHFPIPANHSTLARIQPHRTGGGPASPALSRVRFQLDG
jgi:hypothetical protein